MQGDLAVDAMDRNFKSGPNAGKQGSGNNGKSLSGGAQSDRQKDQPPYSRYPRKNNKPNPQKNQSCQDKRPQSRNFYGGNTETYRGKAGSEAGSGLSAFYDEKKQKKVNLNHLLNFTYDAAASEQTGTGRKVQSIRGGQRSHLPRYNKELYLQATCQFVVDSGGDYTVHSIDPDHPVEWDLIEQVRLNNAHVPSCPICLYPPTAGKIAKCGHVFCYSCVLHYLGLSDKAWRKCPICYDPIDRKTLKSLSAVGLKEYKVGDEICLRLMRKERNSTHIFPVDSFDPTCASGPPSIDSSAPNQIFAKILTASPSQVLDLVVTPEKEALEKQLKEDGSEPEACFIQEALTLVNARIEQLEAKRGGLKIATKVEEKGKEEEAEAPLVFDSKSGAVSPEVEKIVYASAFDETLADPTKAETEKSEDSDGDLTGERGRNISECSSGGAEGPGTPEETVMPEDLDISGFEPSEGGGNKTASYGGARPRTPKSTFYFYQSSDSQGIYLHALNVKMLVEEYGSLENCPPVITGKIVELESTRMGPELRARLRYLDHLTLSAQFQVAEVRLSRGLLSPRTVSLFRDDVEDRDRRRARRARTERQRERRIQEQTSRQYGGPVQYPPARFRLDSSYHFPEPEPAGSNDYNAEFAPLPPSDRGQRKEVEGAEASVGGGAVGEFSFARMLKEGKKQERPAQAAAKPAETGILTLRKQGRGNDSDSDDVELPAPAYRESLGDAIALALERATLMKKPDEESKEKPEGKKKKKGNKGVVLFQTGMCRGSAK